MDKLESMVLEAETVSALMIQMADDDVGDTSFAVMSDLGENGTEHECDLGVHETALRASAVIDALLAELEAKKKHIADIENVVAAAKCDDELWDAMAHRLKTLEDKLATPVRLKKVDSSNVPFAGDGFNAAVDYCAKAVRAAGFTVEGDE